MKFTLEIECDNAAFCDDDGDPMPECEVARILRELCKDVEQRGAGGMFKIWDANHHLVGRAQFIED